MIEIDDIVAGVAETAGWDAARRERAARDYLAFLSTGAAASPARDVDAIWHEHILHTRRYREACDALAGGFVDHDPAPGGVNGRLGCCGGNGRTK